MAKQNTFTAELALKVSDKKADSGNPETPVEPAKPDVPTDLPHAGMDCSGIGMALLLVIAGGLGVAVRRRA